MKVISIAYQSNLNREKLFLGTSVANDFAEAEQKIKANLNQNDPSDKIAVATTTIEIDFERELNERSPSWTMTTIIQNKDAELFNVSKKYLSESEVKYIEEKLCQQK